MKRDGNGFLMLKYRGIRSKDVLLIFIIRQFSAEADVY